MNVVAAVWILRVLVGLTIVALGLFIFIVLRRLALQRRDRLFEGRYRPAESDIIEALYSSGEQDLASIISRYRSCPDVLASVLVNLIRLVDGKEKEILKTLFALTLRDEKIADLESRNFFKRLNATRLLGLFSDASNVPALLRRLDDKPLIQLAAVQAIAGFRGAEILDFVFQSFEADPRPNIHRYGAIIAKHGAESEGPIRDFLRRPQPLHKKGILIEMAGIIPIYPLQPDIVAFASHPDKEIRIKVARALGRMLIPDSYETLAAMAGDVAWEVEAQAVKSLGLLHNPEALDILVRGLHSSSWHVRHNSGEALLEMGAVGIGRLKEVSRQTYDHFASNMADMALEEAAAMGAGA
jgi:HEAT repeat protein